MCLIVSRMTLRRPRRAFSTPAKSCCERWGIAKVTIEDIAAEAGVSRATLYRLFPGGKDVLFDALRVRELEDFFTRLSASLDGAVDSRRPPRAHRRARHARTARRPPPRADAGRPSPGETRRQLTVDGACRASSAWPPLFLPRSSIRYLPGREGARLVDLLARLVISYFLAPSEHVDLGDDRRRPARSSGPPSCPAFQPSTSPATGATP